MTDVSTPDQQAGSVKVRLPAAFYGLTGGRKLLPATGGTIREILTDLDQQCPGVLDRLVNEDGAMKRYVNVYRNNSDIRSLDGLETTVASEDVVMILPAVAGGSHESVGESRR